MVGSLIAAGARPLLMGDLFCSNYGDSALTMGLLLPAVEARVGYRVEALGWALYGATSLSLLALAIWFLTRRRVRASFAKSRA